MALDGKVWGQPWPPTYLLYPPSLSLWATQAIPTYVFHHFPTTALGVIHYWHGLLFIIIAVRAFISLISFYILIFCLSVLFFFLIKNNSRINENILPTRERYMSPFPQIFLSFWESDSKPYVWEAMLYHWFYYSTTIAFPAQLFLLSSSLLKSHLPFYIYASVSLELFQHHWSVAILFYNFGIII